jgi:hypothetical protein
MRGIVYSSAWPRRKNCMVGTLSTCPRGRNSETSLASLLERSNLGSRTGDDPGDDMELWRTGESARKVVDGVSNWVRLW